MIFSTETNGFSLNQLYRRSVDNDPDTPVLLIVKDVEQNVKNKIKYSKLNFLFLVIWCVYITTIIDK